MKTVNLVEPLVKREPLFAAYQGILVEQTITVKIVNLAERKPLSTANHGILTEQTIFVEAKRLRNSQNWEDCKSSHL